jgi:acyl-CoA synthetase (AMP-forming)/AMP-acid ligase II
MTISLLLDIAQSMDAERLAVGSRAAGITTTRLRDLAGSGATVLSQAGARSLAFVGVNGPAFPVAMFASARAGVPLAPLNYRLSASALAAQIGRLDAPLIVTDPEYAATVGNLGRPVISTDDLLRVAGGPETGSEPVDDENAAAVMLFTSGTTADPKCVILRHRNLESYVLRTVEPVSRGTDEAALVSVPPYHIAGVGTVLTNVFGGRRLLYLPGFGPQAWIDTVRSEEVTFAMVVPTMLARIVEVLAGTATELPTLRSIAYGGARMPEPLLRRALELLPEVDFVNAYGLTETSSTIAVLGPGEHRAALASDSPAKRGRLGSVGRLIDGVEGEIRDDHGRALPSGSIGELWVRGAQVSGEYVEIGSVLDPDGWFPTRDRARFDDDGYLYVLGRTDDVIIRGGENISPAEIEDVLLLNPAVAEAAVVGVPDEQWGERIGAVVVLVDGCRADPGELREWVRVRLRSSKTPDWIVVRGELPQTDTGKVLRRALVAEFADLGQTTWRPSPDDGSQSRRSG